MKKEVYMQENVLKTSVNLSIGVYKITKIVHALWLAERSVCMTVCIHGCGLVVASSCLAFRALITQARIWKSFRVQNSTSYPFLRRLKHGKSLERRWVNFSLLKPAFWARKIRILQSIFLQNKNWLRMQGFVDKILQLVRISLLISAIQNVLRFFSGKLFYKSNRKFFPVFA